MIHMSEIVYHGKPSKTTVHQLSEDLLAEIFFRLPPDPLCLLWVSLVCKFWYGILNDGKFISWFRRYHTPPILGFFCSINLLPAYIPTTIGPRFSLPSYSWQVLHCRHGHALLYNLDMLKLCVWNPITGDEHHMSMPPEFSDEYSYFNATIHCAAGHAHCGDCCSNLFDIAFVSIEEGALFLSAYVYSSEISQWSDAISISCPHDFDTKPPILVADTIYWSLAQNNILEFDMKLRSLGRSEVPYDIFVCEYKGDTYLMPTEDGKLGFAGIQRSSIHLWSRETDSDGATSWLLRREITDVHNLFSMQMVYEDPVIEIVGVAEDGTVIFVRTSYGIFMVHLNSMQFKKVFEGRKYLDILPYASFYIAGGGICGGYEEAEVLNNI